MTKDELHAAIMNIPCHGFDYAYKQGHKDARHAAAELVMSTPPQPTERSAEIEAVQRDAMRWRRLVNASELEFPVATIVDDPENDKNMLYGRKRLENYIEGLDEISDSYDAAIAAAPQKGEAA